MRKTHMLAIAFSAALSLFAGHTAAEELPFKAVTSLRGKVVSVADGDTITLLTAAKQQIRVRLWGIDCPESGQAFGQKAKNHASDLVAGKTVTVEVQGTDRYGRSLGWVLLAEGGSLNAAQVEAGWAWWYKHYAPSATRLQALEDLARKARRGLWQDPDPMAPWDWRRSRRR